MRLKIQKLLGIARQEGPVRLFSFLFSAIGERLSTLFYEKIDDVILVWDLAGEKKLDIEHPLILQKIDESSLPLLMEFCRQHGLSSQIKTKLQNYIKNRFNGFTLNIDGEMIGFMWWVDNRLPLRHNHPSLLVYGIDLKDDEVYMFDNYIAPPFRGNANSLQSLAMLRRELRDQGYRKGIGYVRANNRPARWTYAVQGFEIEGESVRHKFLRIFLYANNRVFVKNHRLYSNHTFEYRPVVF